MERGRFTVGLAGLLLLLAFVGCGRQEEAPPAEVETRQEERPSDVATRPEEAPAETPVAVAKGDPQAGKAIYDGICVACHGADGNAMIPGVPSFAKGEAAGGKKLSERSDEELRESIVKGIQKPAVPGAPPMPPYGGGAPLDDKQLDDLIAYIRSLAG